MPIRRGNPFEDIEDLIERMSGELERVPVGPSSIAIDVEDRGDAFVVTADLPGFEKGDIEVTIADRTLRIDADRDTDAEVTDVDYIRRERSRGGADRSVRLPEAVDEDGITARYANGVLTVTLEKQDADGGKQIQIE